MREWWYHRTASTRRTPKKALPRMAVVVRGNLSWSLVLGGFVGFMALALVEGINFEPAKFSTVFSGLLVAICESWLLMEPAVIFVMIVLPRALDSAMTPTDKEEQRKAKEAKRRAKALDARGARPSCLACFSSLGGTGRSKPALSMPEKSRVTEPAWAREARAAASQTQTGPPKPNAKSPQGSSSSRKYVA